ncbi:MAG: acyl-CoA dehydrogenase family protein [Actinomycetota bacterium]
MDPFLQDAPQPANRFRTDRTLRYALERLLPPEVFAETSPMFDETAERVVTDLRALALRAEANLPVHVAFDAWGRRVDRVDVDPAWLELVRVGQEMGLVAIPYEGTYDEHSRLVQFGLIDIWNPSSAVAGCPLSMTDAAARVLLNDDPQLAVEYVPKMTARANAWTSGQWMTEKEGGSDVGRTGTIAREAGDGWWTLHGTKWFTSATTADMSLALARPEGAGDGSRALSLFVLDLRNADGTWNGISVRRLKDKLGTKALPTAELDLDGTAARLVGGMGRGVPKVAAMLNITRVWAAFGSLSAIGSGLMLARDYAGRREAFGRLLRDLPVHRGWIARIAAEYEAANALAYRAAHLLGQVEQGTGDAALARVVIPLTKMSVARRSVWATSNLIESFGGMGYLEDTGLPRILRDAHVNCIWEGTTSVMALDVLRALRAPGVADSFLADVEARARAYDHPLIAGPARAVAAAAGTLKPMLAEPAEADARRIAWGMARTYQAALLCEAAGWALDKKADARTATAATLFTSEPLIGAEPPVGDEDLGALAFDSIAE